MPLAETMMVGYVDSLIFLESAEFLLVLEKNLHRLDRHRAIGVHRHPRYLAGLHQVFQHEKKLLGSFHGERWYHHAAAALDGGADKRSHLRPGIIVRMQAIAVSALHHQQVATLAFRWTGMHHAAGSYVVIAHAPDVAGKQKLLRGPIRRQRDLGHARPEYVRRTHQAKCKLAAQLLGLAELHWVEQRHALQRFFHGVERQGGIVLGIMMLVGERRVFFLQVTGVGQQDAAEIDRRGRGVDRSVKALLYQPRNPAGMIEVRMRKDDGINLARRYGQISPVALPPFLLALEKTAIDQHLNALLACWAIGVDKVLRPGNYARCA
jgi:hypothetical protein